MNFNEEQENRNENNGFYNDNNENQQENNNPYGQNNNEYAFNVLNSKGKPKTLGWSVASMVTGILSVVCCCFGWTGIIFGIAAIVLSVVSRKSLGYFDGMSIAGLVVGIFGLVFGVAITYTVYFNPEFAEQFNKIMEEYYSTIPEGEM